MREIIGFDNGDSILAPGGTISNMYGLLCARHKHFPEYKEKGAATFLEEPLAVYTSAQVCIFFYSLLHWKLHGMQWILLGKILVLAILR